MYRVRCKIERKTQRSHGKHVRRGEPRRLEGDGSPETSEGSVREGTAVLARRWVLATRLQDGPVFLNGLLRDPPRCSLAQVVPTVLVLVVKLRFAVFSVFCLVPVFVGGVFSAGVDAARAGLEGEVSKRGRFVGLVFAVREQRRELLFNRCQR